VPKVRAVTIWIMTSPDQLADTDRAGLDAILAVSPELAAVTASVRDFAVMMNERRGRKLLEPWMTAAEATGEPALRSFVTGLRADRDAVTNGRSLRWSSGAVDSAHADERTLPLHMLCADQHAHSLSAISSEVAGQALDPILGRPSCRLGTACRWWSHGG